MVDWEVQLKEKFVSLHTEEQRIIDEIVRKARSV